jgi:hypothetical protein
MADGGRLFGSREALTMTGKIEIITVDRSNVAETGFFCYMSKRKSEGYLRKLAWVAARFGKGLTILRSDQCPYLPDATRILLEAAAKKKIKVRVVEFRTAAGVQTHSPSPYGVFNVVYNGRLLGYHYLLKEDFLGLLGRNP